MRPLQILLLCKKCGFRRYPEDDVELYWHKRGYKSWGKVALEGPCKLVTFTRLWALPLGYEQLSLMLGVVEFRNGIKALGQLQMEDPEIGMKLVAKQGVI